jgi:putative toxin-antitoxin system antitoxin component (TIGR02293 family)
MGSPTPLVSDPFAGEVSATTLLGGARIIPLNPRTPLDWVALIRQGIASGAVEALTQALGVSRAELAGALRIPERTLARRKREGVLSSEESAKLVRLARAVERAEEVFEGLEPALDWLKSPNAALAGAVPISLMDTDIGAESVLDTLGRIEHGVYA